MINLIQAGTITSAILGGLLLWRTPDFRGIGLLYGFIALASMANILEESGVTRDIYLVSPAFIILTGPAIYLAILKLTKHELVPAHYLHLVPGVLALGFTEHVQIMIGVGTAMRFIYAGLTGLVLFRYMQMLDEERSDSNEFSLTWLIWAVIIMTLVNFVDLVRLNIQHLISWELNLLGQGFNNLLWLITIICIAVKLSDIGKVPPKAGKEATERLPDSVSDTTKDEYQPIFDQLNAAIEINEWYRQPRLTLSDLSELSGLKPRDISRAINLVAQRSFNDYINAFRIRFVCKTIEQQPGHSITRMSSDAGFSSKASFNQIFKKTVGQTPSQYKTRHKG